MNGFPMLSALTVLPLAGGLAVMSFSTAGSRAARRLALAVSLGALGLTLCLWAAFSSAQTGFQFEEKHDWVPSLAVAYHLGIDGLGLIMLLLAAIVTPMALLASSRIESPRYHGLVLWVQAGLFGTFTALNFFHWFLFWELSLVPAFFLIRLWGGARRSETATQFFVYTMTGSVALLLAFLGLFLAGHSFEFSVLTELGRKGELAPALAARLGAHAWGADALGLLLFTGVFLGFAVKIPVLPFHTWLPATYAEAPVGTTLLLTGAMSKMGVYGLLRILAPIFPDQMRQLATPLLWLAVATIVFSAGAAFAQRDLKRLLAYSSINHLGYCLLGIVAVAGPTGLAVGPDRERAAALAGVCLQMFNHGLTAALLFWFAGLIEARGGGRRGLDDFGGLRKVAPVFCGLMGIALFSSLGLPGLNGFVGEFLIFKGAFPLVPWAAACAVPGLLITAVFILTLIQRVFHGPLPAAWQKFPDLTLRERCVLAPAIALMFALGLYPQFLLGPLHTTVQQMANPVPVAQASQPAMLTTERFPIRSANWPLPFFNAQFSMPTPTPVLQASQPAAPALPARLVATLPPATYCQVRELDYQRWPAQLLPLPIRWGEGFSWSPGPRSPL